MFQIALLSPIYMLTNVHLPGKHKTTTQCWVNVGPASTTLAQLCPSVGALSRVLEVGSSTFALLMAFVMLTALHARNICLSKCCTQSLSLLLRDGLFIIDRQFNTTYRLLVVSSSSRPWMDVFALPEKSTCR